MTWEEHRMKLAERLIKRCEKDEEKGYINTAIARYQGFLSLDFTNQNIRNRLATLLIEIGDKKKAGRNLYFKENPSEVEKECIAIFEKSYGNCPLIIANKLISYQQPIEGLDIYAQNRLHNLIIATEAKFGLVPKFLVGAKGTLKRLRNKSPKKKKDTLTIPTNQGLKLKTSGLKSLKAVLLKANRFIVRQLWFFDNFFNNLKK